MSLRNINLKFLLFIYCCAFSSYFCNKWLMAQFIVFFLGYTVFRSYWMYFFFLHWHNFEATPLILTQMYFIKFLLFLRTYSLLMLKSWPFKINIINKMPKFFRFMRSKCRFSHSKEKMDLHRSLHDQIYWQY